MRWPKKKQKQIDNYILTAEVIDWTLANYNGKNWIEIGFDDKNDIIDVKLQLRHSVPN